MNEHWDEKLKDAYVEGAATALLASIMPDCHIGDRVRIYTTDEIIKSDELYDHIFLHVRLNKKWSLHLPPFHEVYAKYIDEALYV